MNRGARAAHTPESAGSAVERIERPHSGDGLGGAVPRDHKGDTISFLVGVL